MSRVLPVFENGFTEAGHLILKIYLLDETKVDLGDATLPCAFRHPWWWQSTERRGIDPILFGGPFSLRCSNCNKRLISNNARPDMDALKTTRPSLLLKLYALALDIFVCQDRSIS